MIDGRQKSHVFDFRFHHTDGGAYHTTCPARSERVSGGRFVRFSHGKSNAKSRRRCADVHCCKWHCVLLMFLTLLRTCARRPIPHPTSTTLRRKGRRREGDDDRTGIFRTRRHHHGPCEAYVFSIKQKIITNLEIVMLYRYLTVLYIQQCPGVLFDS